MNKTLWIFVACTLAASATAAHAENTVEDKQLYKQALYTCGTKGYKAYRIPALVVTNTNNWGLYDVHGNAWEYCIDVQHKNYKGAPTDGNAWVKGGVVGDDGVASRVARGGGMRSTDRRVRGANRISKRQDVAIYYVGFRIVCEIPTPPLFPPSDPAPRLFQGLAAKANSCYASYR